MSSINGTGSLRLSGLSSGIDTDSIIQKLIEFGQKRLNQLKARENEITVRQTAINKVQSNLSALQAANAKLAKASNGAFDAKTAKSSDETLATVAAGGTAQPGVTTFRVLGLAKNHQVASQGFDGPGSEISQGTFTIRSGENSATITIDSTNNTLQGLARAISNANIGVTASVINDGSASDTQPYRLLLSSKSGGTTNAISITNSLAADSGSARRPEFGGTFINNAVTPTDLGTSAVTSNYGTSGFTGTSNKTYTFTVTGAGTVGTDTVTLSYADNTGTQTGTITVNAGDVDAFKTLAEGLQVKFGAGTLVAGKKFTIDAYANTVQAASDASVQIGSGSGAITVQSSTNQIQNVIPGVTINLKNVDATKDVEVTVSNNLTVTKDAINGFVKAFNDFTSYIQSQSAIDTTTGKGGPLARDRTVLDILASVQQSVIGVAPNLPTNINRLSAVGITFGRDGKLSVNETKLDDALNGRISGITFDDVKKLFAVTAKPSRTDFEFVFASTKTKESSSAYQIDITQAAEQAAVTATSTLASSTVINNTNNTLQIQVGGVTSGTLTLASGTYTQAQLAKELENRINADTTLAGRRVTVGVASQRLVVTTASYGSSSSVGTLSGNAIATLGFSGSETDTGVDVAGNFIVGGNSEAATGSGQILTGNADNANTDGLQVRIGLTPGQVVGGADGDIQIVRGVASRFELSLAKLLDSTNGRLKIATTGVEKELENAKGVTSREAKTLDDRQASLLRQFAAMEKALSRSKSLTSQLGSIGLSIPRTSSS